MMPMNAGPFPTPCPISPRTMTVNAECNAPPRTAICYAFKQAVELSKVAVMGDFGYIENYKRELVETLFSKVYVIYGVDGGDYLFHKGVYTNLDKARATAKARVLELTDNPADADSSNLMREGYEYWRTSGDAVVVLEEVGFEFHRKGR